MSSIVLHAHAILFDMDGTLVDSSAVIMRVLYGWAERHGLERARIDQLPHGRKTRDTIAGLAPHLDLATEVAALDAAELADLDGISAVAGAATLLAALQPEQWAVVTSADRELARLRLAAAGLPLPQLLIAGDSVVNGKPAPDGYLLAAERLGWRPDECIVFEDAPAGITAGVAAGMRVIGVAGWSRRAELAACTAMIADLHDVSVTNDGTQIALTLHTGG